MSWFLTFVVKPLMSLILSMLSKSLQNKLQHHSDEMVGKFIPEPKEDVKSKEASFSTAIPSEEVSPIVLLGLASPDYRREYREDVINDILWRWNWSETAGPTPDIKYIENLSYFCAHCGMRIEPKPNIQNISGWERYERPHVGGYGRRQTFTTRESYLFDCSNCHTSIRKEISLREVINETNRIIEYRSSDPEMFGAAPNRVRATSGKN